MPLCGYAMMQMSFWWCAMMRMPLWWCNERECPLGYAMNANVLLWVYHDTNALMQTQFIQKFLLFSKRGFHNAWNQKILKTWFIIHEKSSSFWLKAPKKLVIIVRKSLNGAFTWNLMIWLKRLISTIWLSKEMTHFQGLFEKMNSLKIKHLKKIHFCCF